jgi:DNA-binding protein H-NS
MTENELKQMPLPALQALKGAIDARLIELERGRRDAALKAARETARAHGFELETLLPLQLSSPLPGTGDAKKPANGASTPKKEASIGPARYAKPGDPSVTWTGRGRNPTWVKTHLASGRPLAELEIH